MIQSKRNFLATMLGTAALLPTGKFPTPANVYDHLKGCWNWYETQEILQARPLRKNGITGRSDASVTILSDSRRDIIRLNPVAARIWSLCDGRRGVDAMVRTMTSDYEVSPGVCRTDLILALTMFRRKGLISC